MKEYIVELAPFYLNAENKEEVRKIAEEYINAGNVDIEEIRED